VGVIVPGLFRCRTSSWCRSAAFSACSRALDLNGAPKIAKTNCRSPITRSAYAIRSPPQSDEIFGTHSSRNRFFYRFFYRHPCSADASPLPSDLISDKDNGYSTSVYTSTSNERLDVHGRTDGALRPARARLKPPGFILPCQPYLADRPPSGPEWQHEIKWDGYRIIARKDGERVRL
jgi:hypothetical protein